MSPFWVESGGVVPTDRVVGEMGGGDSGDGREFIECHVFVKDENTPSSRGCKTSANALSFGRGGGGRDGWMGEPSGVFGESLEDSEEMLFFLDMTRPGGVESKLATDGLEECELPSLALLETNDHVLSVDILRRCMYLGRDRSGDIWLTLSSRLAAACFSGAV